MTQTVIVSRPNPHLPHDAAEFQAPPPPDARTPELARANAEKIVGRLMRERARQTLILTPDMRCPAPDPAPMPMPEPRAAARPAPKKDRPAPRAAEDDRGAMEAWLRRALLASGPGDNSQTGDAPAARPLRHRAGLAALLVLAAAMVIWPGASGLVLLLLIWSALAGVIVLRAAVANGRWQRFAARRPRQAEALRRVADPLAERFDRVLDLLPENWAEALALPDLSLPAGPAASLR